VNKIRQIKVDIVIFGAGVAGLWLLRRLLKQGYSVVLLEADSIGAGQTRYAQGIIHGGTKYALTGKVSDAAQTVAAMPERWRRCLDGEGELDLAQVKVLSDFQYLWSTTSLTSRMAGFFASKLMRSRTQLVSQQDYPALFQNPEFKGQVYQLDEPVLDVASLLYALAEPAREHILKIDAADVTFDCTDTALIKLKLESMGIELTTSKVVLMAGKGNQSLLALLDRDTPSMQLRPLHMVAVRGRALTSVYAHCLGASVNPRITISSHQDSQGQTVWYLGGQLAEEGVERDAASQIKAAQKELMSLFPWLDCSACEWMTLPVERAEVAQMQGHRPDTVYAQENHHVITAWPTKLALSPVLAEQIERLLQEDGLLGAGETDFVNELKDLPHPRYAVLPWQEEGRWSW